VRTLVTTNQASAARRIHTTHPTAHQLSRSFGTRTAQRFSHALVSLTSRRRTQRFVVIIESGVNSN
jgi:hypothetical protein